MKRQNYIATIFLFLIVGSAGMADAQKNNPVTPFEKGSVTVNLGAGSGVDYKNVNYNSAFGTKVALEFGLWQAGPGVISLGPEIGGSFSRGGRYNDFKSRTFIVAARSAWHYGWKVAGLDTYAGLSTGVGFHHYDYNNDGYYKYDDVIPVFGGFVGASYFFTPTFGVNVEAGYDITSVQGGLVFKLK